VLLAAAALPAQELRAGAAQVIITPPKGAPMSGYYHNRAASGVHDDLHAKAIVLESGGVRSALVACDLLGIPRSIIDKARTQIERDTAIPASRVMISATHAHTGPVLLSAVVRYNLEGEMKRIAEEYAESVPGKIAESVRLATAALQPARLRAGIGREDSLTFNRRFHMKDGSVGWNPGKLNPNIVRPAGPIDGSVPVIYLETMDGQPIAVYVNYALHLDTVGGLEYSADYPYTLARALSAAKGQELTMLFTIGCAGNLNHIDVSDGAPQKGHGEAARIGTILAAQVLKTLKHAKAVNASQIQASSEILKLPLPDVTPGEVDKARTISATFGKPDAAPFLDLVRAGKIMDVAQQKSAPLDAEVQVITLGDQIAWIGLPGEIFVELGLAIKNASPFPYTIIAELANGSIGYVPDRKGYQQGAYEAISSRYVAGSGEMLVDSAVRQLLELYKQ
jgi:hypothetical protein